MLRIAEETRRPSLGSILALMWDKQEEHREESTCAREHCARAHGGSDDRKCAAAWVRDRRSIAAVGRRRAATESDSAFCGFATVGVAHRMARRSTFGRRHDAVTP